MDVLVSYVVLFVCAAFAIVLYCFQNLERARQDGDTVPSGFVFFLGGVVFTLSFAALGFMGNGVLRFQAEFGMYSGVPPMAVSAVLWYSVWLAGWETGRIEGRSAEKPSRNVDSAKH